MYDKETRAAIKLMPSSADHEGVVYHRTGKCSTMSATGEFVVEMDSPDNDASIWVNIDGRVLG